MTENKKKYNYEYKTGRPPKYESCEELQSKIDEYFKGTGFIILKDDKGKEIQDKNGKPVVELKAPTIAGLALHLDFASRQSIYDYRDKNENKDFSYLIKKAIMKIEDFAEQMLYSGRPVGSIFWLKNHGWKDETKMKVTIEDIIEEEEK